MPRRVVTINKTTPCTADPKEAERLLREHRKVMLFDRPMEPGGVPGTWISIDWQNKRKEKKFEGVQVAR